MTRRRLAGSILLMILAGASTALAQPAPSPAPGFLTDYDFHLEAAALTSDDPAFRWDANFGGDLDLFDYGAGRINVLANYHVVLGTELQPFDPNQGNYTLEASASYRRGANELIGAFHHRSRHLGDRPKRFGIDWNAIAVRVARREGHGRFDLRSEVEVQGIINRSFVDYRWGVGFGVAGEYPNDRRVSAVGGVKITALRTDPDIASRDGVWGGSADVGVRIDGAAGALELFVAVERRIDPDPLGRGTRSWGLLGFRILNR